MEVDSHDKVLHISIDRLKVLVELYFSKRVHNGICCINEMVLDSFQCCGICNSSEVCTLLGTLK